MRPTGRRAKHLLGRQRFVYANGADLYVASRNGTDSHKLVSVAGVAYQPRFSPDGSGLRFSVDGANESSSLWEIRSDGTGLHQLLPGWNQPQQECCGSWTPDGKYFVFQAVRDNAQNIWIITEPRNNLQPISREPVQLTIAPLSYSLPVPDKDGKRLFAVGQKKRIELLRYDIKAGQFVPFLSGTLFPSGDQAASCAKILPTRLGELPGKGKAQSGSSGDDDPSSPIRSSDLSGEISKRSVSRKGVGSRTASPPCVETSQRPVCEVVTSLK
jgi:hypothetical protein